MLLLFDLTRALIPQLRLSISLRREVLLNELQFGLSGGEALPDGDFLLLHVLDDKLTGLESLIHLVCRSTEIHQARRQHRAPHRSLIVHLDVFARVGIVDSCFEVHSTAFLSSRDRIRSLLLLLLERLSLRLHRLDQLLQGDVHRVGLDGRAAESAGLLASRGQVVGETLLAEGVAAWEEQDRRLRGEERSQTVSGSVRSFRVPMRLSLSADPLRRFHEFVAYAARVALQLGLEVLLDGLRRRHLRPAGDTGPGDSGQDEGRQTEKEKRAQGDMEAVVLRVVASRSASLHGASASGEV
jgi:hypothetical protein